VSSPGGPDPASISVIIPCHNYGRFLADAVGSVRDQTRPADEIVIVDDGSTDGSVELARLVMSDDPSARLVTRPTAGGPSVARNDGWRASSGALLVFLDADDRLSPTYLADLARALEQGPADVAYAGEVLFGAEQGSRRPPPFSRRSLHRENFINVSAMVRRSVLESSGGFDPTFDRHGREDWELWIRCIAAGARAVPVDTCHLGYRRHAGGSRNSITRITAARAHLAVWMRHHDVVSPLAPLSWALGGTARQVRRRVRRVVTPDRAGSE
jgi:glycosyltransferase involved in cell wall biosynthesis